MATGIQKAWSVTANSNGNADSNISYIEGQSPPSLNDSARAAMAATKAFANQITGAKTSGGSSNAYTFTSDAPGAISSAYAAGMAFVFKANHTNNGASTLDVDGVGAVAIRKGGAATALAANDIVADGMYAVFYNGTYWILINPETGQTAAGNQPRDATLTALAALTWVSDEVLVRFTAADTVSLTNSVKLANNGLSISDTGGDHFLTIVPGSNLSANRALTLTTGDANRTFDISASDVTISAAGAELINDANAAAQLTTLGCGTAATRNTGTSGATVPLCNGTNTFSGELTLQRAGGVLITDRTGTDGTIVAIQQDGVTEGSISVSATTVAYNTFLGSHWSQLVDWTTPDILKGTIIETVDAMCRWVWDEWQEMVEAAVMAEREIAPNIVEEYEREPAQFKRRRAFYRGDLIPGQSYVDAEGREHLIVEEATDRLPRAKVSDTPGSKRAYGVFMHWEYDDGAPDMYVGALGAYVIRIAPGEIIEGGELIESNGDGCGRVQGDDLMRASTVAKITSAEAIEAYPDGSKLYPCTLHCG